ncbi:MAG: hypothetical protein IJV70_02050 [Clostridia bacterium]|nr:hypothetical protein [Clostridia bacterium]
MNAPCSARKDKSGIFSNLKMILWADRLSLIIFAVMFILLGIGTKYISDEYGGFREIIGLYDELGGCTEICSLICIVFAFAAGIISTNYLSNSESAEFYDKFPIGRRKVFAIKIVRDTLVCLCTIVVSLTILYGLVLILPSRLTARGNLEAVIALAKLYIPYFLMYYSIGVWVGTLCGGLYTKALSFVLVYFLIAFMAYMIPSVVTNRYDEFEELLGFTGAFAPGFRLFEYFERSYQFAFAERHTSYAAITFIVLITASVYISGLRKVENTDSSIAFLPAARIFRFIAVLDIYLVMALKVSGGFWVRLARKINSDLILAEDYVFFQYFSKDFNTALVFILMGVFLLASYPLVGKKKLIYFYDYVIIFALLAAFELLIAAFVK